MTLNESRARSKENDVKSKCIKTKIRAFNSMPISMQARETRSWCTCTVAMVRGFSSTSCSMTPTLTPTALCCSGFPSLELYRCVILLCLIPATPGTAMKRCKSERSPKRRSASCKDLPTVHSNTTLGNQISRSSSKFSFGVEFPKEHRVSENSRLN